jgi:hypothetical protein
MPDFAELPGRIQHATFSKPSQRGAEYKEKELNLRISEDRAVDFMAKLTSQWRDTAAHLDYLSNELHSAVELREEIEECSRAVTTLQLEVMKSADSDVDERRAVTYLINFRRKIDVTRAENDARKKKNADQALLLKKKEKQFKKRRGKMLQTEEWLVETEKARVEKGLEVAKMERTVLELEIKLNERLCNAQAMSKKLKPLDTIDGKSRTTVRIEEMAKVIELVGIERTEAV